MNVNTNALETAAMLALAAVAQANALEAAFLTPSPHRSNRPGRSQRKVTRVVAAMARPFVDALSRAADEPFPTVVPLRGYPY